MIIPPPNGLARGCCSAVSPCAHQRRDPTTICGTCHKARDFAYDQIAIGSNNYREALHRIARFRPDQNITDIGPHEQVVIFCRHTANEALRGYLGVPEPDRIPFGPEVARMDPVDRLGVAIKRIERLRSVLLECKHGAEYPDELGDKIDAAIRIADGN